ncbi:MAG TPA: carboxypeptidase-like regulatory domain-containing protein, partial [Chitinophagaceae bacterium]|nr:carboxypeptidase-like regulatory domain-containing protein [Chitinophagaceae bacterium]
MHSKIVILLLSFLFCVQQMLHAQDKKYTISGYVRDQSSGENLPAANVGVVELKRGVNTNNYGFFSISVPEGNYQLKV